MGCGASKSAARLAARTSGTSSLTGRIRPACATASIRWLWTSSRPTSSFARLSNRGKGATAVAVDVRSERLTDLVDENVEVEQLGTGFTFTEGPIWHPGGEYLLFSDMPGDVRRRWSEDEGV